MHHDVRGGAEDGRRHGCGVEGVHHDTLDTARAQCGHVALTAGRHDDVMALRDQAGNQLSADDPGPAGDEYTHVKLLHRSGEVVGRPVRAAPRVSSGRARAATPDRGVMYSLSLP
ncbi:hypothetical protein GCM10022207_26740 [Streptomyces lannensis]|uniref:Uncharacterized protein n=1 Tax=Streptomyces lannensis TaxID=766498 RepID=A0ABP7K328_9ACTN